jgi:Flp pilus assembly protein TadB
MTLLIVLASTGVGVGIALVVTGFFATTSVAKKMSFTKRIDPTTRHAALAALVGAAVLGLVTRWPVGAAIGAGVGWTLWSAVFSSSPRRTTSRLDALATWIETLRDSVAAHRGLVAAIESTVPSAPASLRANIEALVIRIKSGTPLDKAFAALAAELADASADEAIAPLILAARFGGADLQNLLGSAAASTREQLALVQRTEVARAQPRREMRLVVVVTLGFVLATVTIGHGYFKPFSSTIGQIVLLLITGLFAVGFATMSRLSRPQPMPRLFGSMEKPA